jgi:hypothetical protein
MNSLRTSPQTETVYSESLAETAEYLSNLEIKLHRYGRFVDGDSADLSASLPTNSL